MTQSLRERALAAFHAHVEAQEAVRQAQREAQREKDRKRNAEWVDLAVQGVSEALGASAVADPINGVAIAEGLRFRADREGIPGTQRDRWRLLVYQPCEHCGGPTSHTQNVWCLADLGAYLDAWQTYATTCQTCQDKIDQMHEELAERARQGYTPSTAASEPIEDEPTPQLEPTLAERLEAVIREIVRDEMRPADD
jgi:hypothetical protein